MYGGSGPESELEVKAVISSINKKINEWDAFLTIHSYGQLWYIKIILILSNPSTYNVKQNVLPICFLFFINRLVPYGYSLEDKPVGDAEIRVAAKVGADAIKDYNGTKYYLLRLKKIF